MKHFAVALNEVQEPKGYAGATIRGCMCCGRVLSGMGGGGRYLCADCLNMMDSGEMVEAIYLLRRRKENENAI